MKKITFCFILTLLLSCRVIASDAEMCKNYLYVPDDPYFKYYVEGKGLDCTAIMKTVHANISQRDSAHFGDAYKDLDPLWDIVYSFFKQNTPSFIPITISYQNNSSFDWFDMQIFISANHAKGEKLKETVVHESSHLALFRLTDGASNQDAFRFIDEGFASIMGSKIYNSQDDLKLDSIRLASEYHKEGKVSFEKVQNWKGFFGDPRAGFRSLDFKTYHVGASFIHYLIDNHGEEKLYSFFEEIGKTKDLASAVNSIFNEGLNEIETKWLDYVENHVKL